MSVQPLGVIVSLRAQGQLAHLHFTGPGHKSLKGVEARFRSVTASFLQDLRKPLEVFRNISHIHLYPPTSWNAIEFPRFPYIPWVLRRETVTDVTQRSTAEFHLVHCFSNATRIYTLEFSRRGACPPLLPTPAAVF